MQEPHVPLPSSLISSQCTNKTACNQFIYKNQDESNDMREHSHDQSEESFHEEQTFDKICDMVLLASLQK